MQTHSENGVAKLATMLLVDDRESDILLTKVALQKDYDLKCNLLIARDGEEAISLWENERAKGATIDIMLIDINMPVMDGFELLEYFRHNASMDGISVIMCSGSTYDQDRDRAAALGVAGYVVKPAQFDALKPILEQSAGTKLVHHGGVSYSLTKE